MVRSLHEERDVTSGQQNAKSVGLLRSFQLCRAFNAAGREEIRRATLVTCECRHPCVGRGEGRRGTWCRQAADAEGCESLGLGAARRSGLIGLGRGGVVPQRYYESGGFQESPTSIE